MGSIIDTAKDYVCGLGGGNDKEKNENSDGSDNEFLFPAESSHGVKEWKDIFVESIENEESISINNKYLGKFGLDVLIEFIIQKNSISCIQITSLNLYACDIGDIGCRTLCQWFSGSNNSLCQLNLDCNGIGNEGMKNLCKAMALYPKNLTDLHLSFNRISDKGIKKLGSFLCSLDSDSNPISNLKTISLCFNLFGAESCKFLGKALKINKNLESLSLGFNPIGDNGIKHLKSSQMNLKKLELSFIEMSDKGLADICEIISKNETISELIFGFNNFSTENSFKMFCDALETNKTIKTLNLNTNKLKDVDCLALGAVFLRNKTLTDVNLEKNEISDLGMESLCDALRMNSGLCVVSLGGNQNVSESADFSKSNKKLYLEQMLERNREFSNSSHILKERSFVGHNLGDFHDDISVFF